MEEGGTQRTFKSVTKERQNPAVSWGAGGTAGLPLVRQWTGPPLCLFILGTTASQVPPSSHVNSCLLSPSRLHLRALLPSWPKRRISLTQQVPHSGDVMLPAWLTSSTQTTAGDSAAKAQLLCLVSFLKVSTAPCRDTGLDSKHASQWLFPDMCLIPYPSSWL